MQRNAGQSRGNCPANTKTQRMTGRLPPSADEWHGRMTGTMNQRVVVLTHTALAHGVRCSGLGVAACYMDDLSTLGRLLASFAVSESSLTLMLAIGWAWVNWAPAGESRATWINCTLTSASRDCDSRWRISALMKEGGGRSSFRASSGGCDDGRCRAAGGW
jgi:hypothetical protein